MRKFFIVMLGVMFLGVVSLMGSDIITQGQFAVKMVKVIKAQTPEEVLDEQTAIGFLESLRIAPKEGWNISAPLTEGALVQLLAIIGIPFSSSQPEALVTVSKADSLLRHYAKKLKEYYLLRYNADNSTDSAIVDEGAIPAPSASPPTVE